MHPHFKKTLCLLALLLAANGATAKICKTIGPDGSVTFTDRPSGDASCGKADAPVAPAKPTNATTAAVSQTSTTGAKRAIPARAVEQTSAATVVDPAVEKAVIGVMGLEDLVQRSYDLCTGVLPTSGTRYGAAADAWRARNAVAVAQSRRALANSFDASQQRQIVEGLKLRNQQSLAPIAAAPKQSQIKWCDQSAGEVDAHALDVKENLKAPLSVY